MNIYHKDMVNKYWCDVLSTADNHSTRLHYEIDFVFFTTLNRNFIPSNRFHLLIFIFL